MNRWILKSFDSRSFDLDPGLNRLGRNPTNDVRIADASVSSFHCEISVSDESVLVRDLGSTNGTFIDGMAISESPLLEGQSLQLGTFKLQLVAADDSAPIVRIPELPHLEPQALPAPLLPDGSFACLHHPALPAVYQCTRCNHALCAECVRHLSVAGGKELHFCPGCNAACELLSPQAGANKPAAPAGYSSLIHRFTQTLKIRFKR